MNEFLHRAQQSTAQFELYQITATETPVRFENNRLKGIDTSQKRINALRVVKDGKLGFATSTAADLNHLLDMALATAQFGRPWEAKLPGPAALPQVELEHQSAQVSTDAMVEMGQSIIAALGKCHPDLLASASVSKTQHTVQLINSEGFAGSYSKTMFSVFGHAELVEGQNLLSLYAGFMSGKRENQVEKTIDYLVENFHHGRTNAPLTSGNYTVLFTPQGMMDMLRPLLACANGKAVEKGFSPWRDKLGQRLLNDAVSLYDDPTIPFAPASCLFDGEGIPASPTTIIGQGTVNSFLLDLATAHSLGLEPTGNGFRWQPDELPGPDASNIVLEIAGGKPLADLVRSIKRGVIIHSLMGAWAGNPFSGQVSGNIDLGFLVEDGQIRGRVKDCMMSVNVFDAFREQLVGASTEREWAWTMLTPHVLFEDVSISAKA